MDYKRINELLEKYWSAETTLEEETELQQFFQQEDIPDKLKESAQVFRYFYTHKHVEHPDPGFDRKILNRLKELRNKKSGITRSHPGRYLRVAAAIAGILVATYILQDSFITEKKDTFEDPKAAYEETKKALELLSEKWNEGKRHAMKISTINEAKEKVKE